MIKLSSSHVHTHTHAACRKRVKQNSNRFITTLDSVRQKRYDRYYRVKYIYIIRKKEEREIKEAVDFYNALLYILYIYIYIHTASEIIVSLTIVVFMN